MVRELLLVRGFKPTALSTLRTVAEVSFSMYGWLVWDGESGGLIKGLRESSPSSLDVSSSSEVPIKGREDIEKGGEGARGMLKLALM